MRRLLSLPLILSAALALTACDGEGTTTAETVTETLTSTITTPTTSIKISTQEITVTETTVAEPAAEPEPVIAPVEANVDTAPRGFASIPDPIPAPAPAPAPAPVVAAYYKNCSEARAAGAAPVYAGSPGYGKHLDRDGDGVGCE